LGHREDDRRRVADQLADRLPALVDLHVERATSEWHLLEALADGDCDVAELGAVAAIAALEAGLVEPLVRPDLGGPVGTFTYEGHLVATDPFPPDSPLENDRVAVGDPLATPAHAALAGGADGTTFPSRVRWHASPSWSALDDDRVSLAATDEFHAPPSLSVHRSYPMPVPALYVRRGVGDPSRLRERFAAVEGGPRWYGDVHTPATVPSDEWLGGAPAWLADVHLPRERRGR
jgi:hypothetical protein